MLTAFVDDGYTRDGRIAEAAGRWPEINFAYRPADASQFTEQFVAERLAKNLVSWDIRNSKGESVPITAENLMRLVHPVLMRIYAIINSTEASDDAGNWQRV
jgi:hypothetical protein